MKNQTWLVQTKRHWDEDARYREMAQREGSGPLQQRWPSAEEVVHANITWLLERLYEPDVEIGCVVRLRGQVKVPAGRVDMSHEAINWGDLEARSCELAGDHWHVVLEEAAPDSYNLCRYVTEWMAVWGWPCNVRAEW